ncbi:MAG: DUF1059 domain-containing protein [Armatimonadia bacterium]|nr:DUF1059 domain-containing protein [Armatimonadia bacterium]
MKSFSCSSSVPNCAFTAVSDGR